MDLMVDFETLGTSSDSVILSLGMIAFDRKLESDDQFYYVELDALQQILDGRKVSQDTVDWWLRTDKEELKRLLLNPLDPKSTEFASGLISKAIDDFYVDKIWSRGYMDFAILNDICGNIYPYWKHADVRTLDTLGIAKMETNSHNAFSDCKNQVAYVREVFSVLSKLSATAGS